MKQGDWKEEETRRIGPVDSGTAQTSRRFSKYSGQRVMQKLTNG